MEILDRMPFTARDAVFKKLAEIASVASLHYEELERYEESLKVLRDEYNIRMTAIEEGMEKGMEKGLAEGMEKGLAEGRAEGKAEGKAEGIETEKIDTIKRLRTAGANMDIMMMATGWSVDEINKVLETLS